MEIPRDLTAFSKVCRSQKDTIEGRNYELDLLGSRGLVRRMPKKADDGTTTNIVAMTRLPVLFEIALSP
jgi:hypothetical protein